MSLRREQASTTRHQTGGGGYSPAEKPDSESGEDPSDEPNDEPGSEPGEDSKEEPREESYDEYDGLDGDLLISEMSAADVQVLDLSNLQDLEEPFFWIDSNTVGYSGSEPLTIRQSTNVSQPVIIIVYAATLVSIDADTTINGGLNLLSTEDVTVHGRGSNININGINNSAMSANLSSLTISGELGDISTECEWGVGNAIWAQNDIIIDGIIGDITAEAEGINARHGNITISENGKVGGIYARDNGINAESGNIVFAAGSEIGNIVIETDNNLDASGIIARQGNITISGKVGDISVKCDGRHSIGIRAIRGDIIFTAGSEVGHITATGSSINAGIFAELGAIEISGEITAITTTNVGIRSVEGDIHIHPYGVVGRISISSDPSGFIGHPGNSGIISCYGSIIIDGTVRDIIYTQGGQFFTGSTGIFARSKNVYINQGASVVNIDGVAGGISAVGNVYIYGNVGTIRANVGIESITNNVYINQGASIGNINNAYIGIRARNTVHIYGNVGNIRATSIGISSGPNWANDTGVGNININASIMVISNFRAFNRAPTIGLNSYEATWSNSVTGTPVAGSGNRYNWSSSHRWVQITTLIRPPAPANLRVAERDVFSVTLEWDAVDAADLPEELRDGAIGYNIYRRAASAGAGDQPMRLNGNTPLTFAPGATPSFRDIMDRDAPGGVSYTYFVRAVATLDDEPPFVSHNSNSVTETTQPPITSALLIPTVTQPDGPFSATVTWSGASRADEYVVERRVVSAPQGSAKVPHAWHNWSDWDGVVPDLVESDALVHRIISPIDAELSNNRFTWVDTSVLPGHVYQYRVTAIYRFNENNEPHERDKDPITSTQRQLTSANMRAPRIVSTNMFGIGLEWDRVEAGALIVGYHVYRRPATPANSQLMRVSGTDPVTNPAGGGNPRFLDTGATPGQRFEYVIEVVVGDGARRTRSGPSTIAIAPAVPNTPAQLIPTITQGAAERFSATVRWTATGRIVNGIIGEDAVERRMRTGPGSGDWTDWTRVAVDNTGNAYSIVTAGTQRTVTDTGLLAGRTYQYRIVRTWSDGSDPSNRRPVTSTSREMTSRALAAPRVNLGETTMFSIALEWDQVVVPSARYTLLGYDIYRRLATESAFPAVPIAEVRVAGITAHTDNLVLPGTTYVYAIRAVFSYATNGPPGSAETGLSLVRQVTTPMLISAQNLMPNVAQESAFSARVSWSTAGFVRGSTEYEVERRSQEADGSWTDWEEADDIITENIEPDSRHEILVKVEPSTLYQFRVIGSWENSEADESVERVSNVRQLRTVDVPNVIPLNLRATAQPTSITATWNAISSADPIRLVGYRLHYTDRSASGDWLTRFVPVPTTAIVSDTIPNLNPNAMYQIWIEGVWDLGTNPELACPACNDLTPEAGLTCAEGSCDWIRFHTGTPSAIVNASTAGPAPGRLSTVAGRLTPTSVELQWTAPAGGTANDIVGYQISKNGVPVAWVYGRDNLRWTDHSLTPGVPVRYTVEAVWYWDVSANEGRMPGLSTAVHNVIPPGPAPAGLTRVSVNPWSFTVGWNAIPVANAARLVAYNVYINDEFLARVPARFIVTPGNTVAQNHADVTASLTAAENRTTAARTGRIELEVNNFLFPDLFDVGGKIGPLTPNTAYNIRVEGVWLAMAVEDGEAVEPPDEHRQRYERTGLLSTPFAAATNGAAPGGLGRDATGATHADLRWTRIPDALGYEIFVSDGRDYIRIENPERPYPWRPGITAQERNLRANRTTGENANHLIRFHADTNPLMRIDGLQPNTAYVVMVRAYWALDSDGEPKRGSWSAAHSFTTTGPAPAWRTGTWPATGLTASTAELWWTWNRATAGNSDIKGFLIYRDGMPYRFVEFNPTDVADTTNLGGNGDLTVTLSGNIFTIAWRDTGLAPGASISYMVQAIWTLPDDSDNPDEIREHGGGGNLSAARTITPLGGIPAGLRAGANGFATTATSLTIQWTEMANQTGATVHEYLVEIGNEPPQRIPAGRAAVGALTRSEPFTGLTPNTLYPARVTVIWNIDPNCTDCAAATCANFAAHLRTGRSSAVLSTAAVRTASGVPAIPAVAAGVPAGIGVRLNWAAVVGATGYFVYRDGERIATLGATAMGGYDAQGRSIFRYEDMTLRPGVAARYTVQAFWCVNPSCPTSDHEECEEAGHLRISAHSGARAVSPPGAIPTRIGAVTPGATQFGVTWTAPALPTGATIYGYVVELWHDNINISDTVNVAQNFERTTALDGYVVPAEDFNPAPAASITFIGLEPNTRYQVRVRVIWAANSLEGCVQCPDVSYPEMECPECNQDRLRYGRTDVALVNAQTIAPAPSGLRVAPGVGMLTNTAARLTWNPLDEATSAVGYMIYRNSVPAHFISDEDFRADGNGWWDRTLSPGIAVRYTVRAYWEAPQLDVHGNLVLDINGNPIGGKPGNRTAVLTVTPPAPIPAGVVARVVSPTEVSVAWNPLAAIAGATLHGFSVELLLAGSVVAYRNVAVGGARFVLFDNLDPNTAYHARVVPIWDAGEGTPAPRHRDGRPSALANVRTTGPAPARVRLVPGSLTHTSARLTWDLVPDRGVAGYIVFRDGIAIDYVTNAEFAANNSIWEDLTLSPRVPVRYTVQAVWQVAGNPANNNLFYDLLGDPGRQLRPGIMSAALPITPLGVSLAARDITVTINNPTMLTVRWSHMAEAVGYVVRVAHPTSTDPEMSFTRTVSASDLRVLQFGGLQPNVRYLVSVAGIWDAGSNPARLTDGELECDECMDCDCTEEPAGYDLSCEDCVICSDCGWVRFREGLRSVVVNAASTAGAIPANLRIVAGTLNSSSVRLAWNPVTDATVTGYLISKNGVPIDFITREDFASSNNTWAYHGLMPGVRAVFTVQACWGIASFPTINGIREWDGFGQPGPASRVQNVDAPDGGRTAPVGVRAVVGGPTDISVTWDAVVGIHGYRVELLLGGRVVASETILRNAPRIFNFGVGDVNPNTAYQVRVVGIWDMGEAPSGTPAWQWQRIRDGRVSSLVAARTTAPAASGLRVAVATDSISFNSVENAWNVRLTWNPPPDADNIGVMGYVIWRDNVPVDFIFADDFATARNTWTDTGRRAGARIIYAIQPMWCIPVLPSDDGGEEFIDARGNWIPNGKPGLRTANLNVTPPQP